MSVVLRNQKKRAVMFNFVIAVSNLTLVFKFQNLLYLQEPVSFTLCGIILKNLDKISAT